MSFESGFGYQPPVEHGPSENKPGIDWKVGRNLKEALGVRPVVDAPADAETVASTWNGNRDVDKMIDAEWPEHDFGQFDTNVGVNDAGASLYGVGSYLNNEDVSTRSGVQEFAQQETVVGVGSSPELPGQPEIVVNVPEIAKSPEVASSGSGKVSIKALFGEWADQISLTSQKNDVNFLANGATSMVCGLVRNKRQRMKRLDSGEWVAVEKGGEVVMIPEKVRDVVAKVDYSFIRKNISALRTWWKNYRASHPSVNQLSSEEKSSILQEFVEQRKDVALREMSVYRRSLSELRACLMREFGVQPKWLSDQLSEQTDNTARDLPPQVLVEQMRYMQLDAPSNLQQIISEVKDVPKPQRHVLMGTIVKVQRKMAPAAKATTVWAGYAEQRLVGGTITADEYKKYLALALEESNSTTESVENNLNSGVDPDVARVLLNVFPDEGNQKFIRDLQTNPLLQDRMRKLLRGMIRYTETTGQILDIMGKNNVFISGEPGEPPVVVADAIFPDPNMNSGAAVRLWEKIANSDGKLDYFEEVPLKNLLNHFCYVNVFAKLLKMSERLVYSKVYDVAMVSPQTEKLSDAELPKDDQSETKVFGSPPIPTKLPTAPNPTVQQMFNAIYG